MTQPALKENKMGYMPVGKLLASMAAPMMLSMLIQALYNIVDSIYVAKLSENALTMVSLAFPVQNIMIGCATGTAVGMNSLLSRSLGSGDRAKANRAAGNGLFLAACFCLLFTLGGFFFSDEFFRSQTKIQEIAEGGADYLRICTTLSFGIFGSIMFERLLQATGRTLPTMFTQATGAIINIILDPIFIFGWGPVPALGIRGAAIATVVGQMVSFLLAMSCHFLKNEDIHLRLKDLRPVGHVLLPILSVGIPSVIMVGIGSAMTLGMNRILTGFTTTAVAVFGAYFKLQSFIFMPVFGLNNAMVSIVAYNYGARKPSRMKKTIKLSCAVAFCFAFAGFLAFQLAPELLLSMFTPTGNFLEIGVPALRTIGWHYLLAGFCIILSSSFQAMGNGIFSTVNSFIRQLLVLLPAAYLLSLTGRLELVWLSFPIAEIAALTVTGLLFRWVYKKKIKPMEGQECAA